jgi:hypothetical protein
MKKIVLFVSSCLSLFVVNAQNTPVSQTPLNKNVVLEELTGIHCGYCPDGHKRANDIAIANPGRVVLVNIHAGSYATPGAGEPDLRTTDGTTLNTFFNPTGYPAGSVQRRPHSSDMTRISTGRGNWAAQATTVLAEPSPVNLAMNATIDAATRVVTVTVEAFYTSPFAAGTNHFLNVGILQNNFEGPQSNYGPYNTGAILPNGNYLHQHIFRGFINTGGTWGESINAASTGVITKTYTYTLPASIAGTTLEIGQLEFFAIVHQGNNAVTTSEVFTGAQVNPTYTNVPVATLTNMGITNTLNLCAGESVAPKVRVSNSGAAITSVNFSTSVNGGTPVAYTYSTPIAQFGSAEIQIPAVAFTPQGTNSVVVTITGVNGGTSGIGATASATKAIDIATVANGTAATVKVTTDRYGSETTWAVKNGAGTTVASGGPYTDGAANGAIVQADVNFNLSANECYTLEVNDAYGDGYDSGYGDGNIEIQVNGTAVAGVPNFATGKLMFDKMKASATASINEVTAAIAMEVFPNPATSGLVNVNFDAQGGDYIVTITDLAGRRVVTENVNNATGNTTVTLGVADLKAGNYLVSILNNGATYTQNLIVK